MDTKFLRYAIEDAERFAKRAKEALEDAYADYNSDDVVFSESTLKAIRRQSLDVTHAMKDLRDSIDVSPAAQQTAAKAD